MNVRMILAALCFALLAQGKAMGGDDKQLFSYAFPQLMEDRTAYQGCVKAVVEYPAFHVNYAGRGKSRVPVENAVMQVLLNRKVTSDGMTERNKSKTADYIFYLGRTQGFYANVRTNVFCIFSKK